MSCEDETVVMSWLVNIDRLRKFENLPTRDDALAHLLEMRGEGDQSAFAMERCESLLKSLEA